LSLFLLRSREQRLSDAAALTFILHWRAAAAPPSGAVGCGWDVTACIFPGHYAMRADGTGVPPGVAYRTCFTLCHSAGRRLCRVPGGLYCCVLPRLRRRLRADAVLRVRGTWAGWRFPALVTLSVRVSGVAGGGQFSLLQTLFFLVLLRVLVVTALRMRDGSDLGRGGTAAAGDRLSWYL